MKIRPLEIILASIFATVNAYSQSLKNTEDPTLCTGNEISVVSCAIAAPKNKIVSVCAIQRDKSITGIEYRFGKKAAVEMTYPVNEKTKNKIYRGTLRATHTKIFGFKINEYFYVIGVPQESFGARAFLQIRKNGSIVKNMQCTSNSFGESEIESNFLTEVDGDALALGIIQKTTTNSPNQDPTINE